MGICTHESIIETTSIYKAPYKDKNNALIYFRNTKNIYKRLELIGEDLNWKKSYIGQGQVSFETKDELPILINKDLLSLNGQREASPEYAFQLIVLLILSVVFGGYCVIIVYNSFCISVSDRKKMFGLLTSMGATKFDIGLSVIFEAFVVGIIALDRKSVV